MWEEAWQTKKTPWDAGQPAPALVDLIQQGDLPQGRVLVPGCGAGYDAFALVSPQRRVWGMDVAPSAVQRFHELRQHHGFSHEQADILCEDFFSWQPDQPFDLIWDYTFLCAIMPDMRQSWAERMGKLVAPAGELITLIFPIREEDGQGPPFAMSTELVQQLLTGTFACTHLAPATSSHPARAGREWLGRWRKIPS